MHTNKLKHSGLSKVKVSCHFENNLLQFTTEIVSPRQNELETENEKLKKKVQNLQTKLDKIRKDYLKDMLKSKQSAPIKKQNPLRGKNVEVSPNKT